MSSSKPISKGSVPLSEIQDNEDLESRADLDSLIDQKSISKKHKRNRSVTKKIIKIQGMNEGSFAFVSENAIQ